MDSLDSPRTIKIVARKQQKLGLLVALFVCSLPLCMGMEESKLAKFRQIRDEVAMKVCGDDYACHQMAMDEANSVDNLINISKSSIDKGYVSTFDKIRSIKQLEDLRRWTIDIKDGASVESYLDRLQIATIQAQPIVQQTMLVLTNPEHKRPRVFKNSFLLPNELQKTQESADMLKDQDAKECASLCKMGTDPAEISNCIGYCEKLVSTTVELQKLAIYRPRPTSMLFDGITEVAASVQAPKGETITSGDNIVSIVTGPNKLLSRDSLNMLLVLSLTLGFLGLIVMMFSQRSSKQGGAHTYLPRPGQSSQESGIASQGQHKSAAAVEEDARPGYVPLTEEEVKLYSTIASGKSTDAHKRSSVSFIKIDD